MRPTQFCTEDIATHLHEKKIATMAELMAALAIACLSSASIRMKKKLVGVFKNQGAKWNREPMLVNDHDIRSSADGSAVPYGVYDLRADRGTLKSGDATRMLTVFHPGRLWR